MCRLCDALRPAKGNTVRRFRIVLNKDVVLFTCKILSDLRQPPPLHAPTVSSTTGRCEGDIVRIQFKDDQEDGYYGQDDDVWEAPNETYWRTARLCKKITKTSFEIEYLSEDDNDDESSVDATSEDESEDEGIDVVQFDATDPGILWLMQDFPDANPSKHMFYIDAQTTSVQDAQKDETLQDFVFS